MANSLAQSDRAFLWRFVRLKETIGWVPNDASVRTVCCAKNPSRLGRACEITVGLQPYLDPFRCSFCREITDRLSNPDTCRSAIGAGLNLVSKDANSRRSERSCQIRHSLALVDPKRAFFRIRKVKTATCVYTANGQPVIGQSRLGVGQFLALKCRQFPKRIFILDESQLNAVVSRRRCDRDDLGKRPVRTCERGKREFHPYVIRSSMALVTRLLTLRPANKL